MIRDVSFHLFPILHSVCIEMEQSFRHLRARHSPLNLVEIRFRVEGSGLVRLVQIKISSYGYCRVRISY